MKKLCTYTLGCRVNHFETTAIADRAAAEGWEVVPWGEAADLCIVNSCALTVLACAKTRQIVRIFARKNPHSKIVVVGCYAKTAPEELEKIPHVVICDKNLLLEKGLGNVFQTDKSGFGENGNPPFNAENIKAVFSGACGAAETGVAQAENTRVDRGLSNASAPNLCGTAPITDRANLKIQDGCSNACSYCIIPRARGKPVSRDFYSILADAQNLVQRGVREIIITGINLAKFSSPEHGGLLGVIDALNAIPELKRIRLGSVEPFPEDFLGIIERMGAPNHKLAHHIHLSAQSFNDTVLEKMRRHYTSAEFFEKVAAARKMVPDLGVGVDIICGHPFEGETEFEDTCRKMQNGLISYAHVFTFSPRPQTLAATWMEYAPPAFERESRARKLRKIASQVARKFADSQVGSKQGILLEAPVDDSGTLYAGLTSNYLRGVVRMRETGLKNALVECEVARSIGATDKGNVFVLQDKEDSSES